MISDKLMITLTVSALYDGDDLINYEVKKEDSEGYQVLSYFKEPKDMKQYIKDLIRSL